MSSVLKKARLARLNATTSNGSPASCAQDQQQQQFDTISNMELPQADRLAELRECLEKRSISAYLVETQDAHQSEYVSEHDKRRAWLTGFTGSAGTVLVTKTKALLWTDGRYFLQVGYCYRIHLRCALCQYVSNHNTGAWAYEHSGVTGIYRCILCWLFRPGLLSV